MFKRLDLQGGRVDVLFKPNVASRYDSFSWVPDGTGFYLVTNEGCEFAALAYYDVMRRALRFVETPDADANAPSTPRGRQ